MSNRQPPAPTPKSAPVPPAAKESHPSMAAPMEPTEEMRTVPPVPTNGKPGVQDTEATADEKDAGADESEETNPGLMARIAQATKNFVAPNVDKGDAQTGSVMDVESALPEGGIEVRATRAGYIYNSRKDEGDVFKIGSMDELGDWMECTHSELEKEHQRLMRVRDGKIAKMPKDSIDIGE